MPASRASAQVQKLRFRGHMQSANTRGKICRGRRAMKAHRVQLLLNIFNVSTRNPGDGLLAALAVPSCGLLDPGCGVGIGLPVTLTT